MPATFAPFCLRRLPLLLALGAAAGSALPALAQAPAAEPAPAAEAAPATPPATAVSPAALPALLDTLVRQGLLTRARADEILNTPQGEMTGSAGSASPAKPVQRVPYLPESARLRLKEELRTEVLDTAREQGWARPGEVPDWLRRVRLSGDLRVRAQSDGLDADNLAPEAFRAQTDTLAWAPDLSNTQHNRQRLTLRARLGLDAALAPDWAAGVRVGTGAAGGNASASSQTLAGSDAKGFGHIPVSLDRAWLRWGEAGATRIEAGRIEVPFERTDLIWPDDLSMDGIAGRRDFRLSVPLTAFVSGGVFPLEEFANTSRDKTLLAVQAGAVWNPSALWQLRGAVAYYNFKNVEGQRETTLAPTGALAGTTGYQSSLYPAAIRQKGNTLINLNPVGSTADPVWGLASKFKPVDFNLQLRSLALAGREATLTLDVVKNTGFDGADIQRRAASADVVGLQDKTLAWQLRAGFGSATMAQWGDWTSFLAWRHVERDAWIDAYTDTTWHLGGTNYQGFSLGTQLALAPRVALGLRYTSTRNLDDGVRTVDAATGAINGTMSSAPLRFDVLQLDLNVKF